MYPSSEQQIKTFIETGQHEELPYGSIRGWVIQEKRTADLMRDALISEVKRRTRALPQPPSENLEFHQFVRCKLSPMVCGLFPKRERELVLSLLGDSVVLLTSQNFDDILWRTRKLNTAWMLANLHLKSIGTQLLGEIPDRLVGVSEENVCYVSQQYFLEPKQFCDFVVHEAARLLCTCGRETVGLRKTKTRSCLLNIDVRQRETFANACEKYSRIIELAPTRKERLKLAAVADQSHSSDDRINTTEFGSLITKAVMSRNGWKKLLETCH